MKMLLGLLAGCGMLAWATGGDPGSTETKGRPASRPSAERPAATAPAGRGARPLPGARKRPLEAPSPREGVAPGDAGPRRFEKPASPAAAPEESLPPAKAEELMQFVRENFPQLNQRLERLRQIWPEEFQTMLRRVGGPLLPIMETRKRDPRLAQAMIEEYRLQLTITSLAGQYRAAKSDEERSRLKTEIQKRTRERFDRHQERIRLEIERLRTRLDEQERRLADREQRKEELLRNECDRLTRGAAPAPKGPRDPAVSEQKAETGH